MNNEVLRCKVILNNWKECGKEGKIRVECESPICNECYGKLYPRNERIQKVSQEYEIGVTEGRIWNQDGTPTIPVSPKGDKWELKACVADCDRVVWYWHRVVMRYE